MNNLVSLKYYNQQGGSDKKHKLVGLQNIGNYCFANAFLQTIYAVDYLRDLISNLDDKKLPTHEEYRNIFGIYIYEDITEDKLNSITTNKSSIENSNILSKAKFKLIRKDGKLELLRINYDNRYFKINTERIIGADTDEKLE